MTHHHLSLRDVTLHIGPLQAIKHEPLIPGDLVLAKPIEECQVGWHDGSDGGGNDPSADHTVYTVTRIAVVSDNRQWVELKGKPLWYCGGCLHKLQKQQAQASIAIREKEPA